MLFCAFSVTKENCIMKIINKTIIIFLLIVSMCICGCYSPDNTLNSLYSPSNQTPSATPKTTPSAAPEPTISIPKIQVTSFDELVECADSSKVKAGDTIYIEASFEVINEVIFTVPVSFTINADILFTERIFVDTTETADVAVFVGNNVTEQDVDIVYDAPFCNLFWDGAYIPGEKMVAEIMNVRMYNGVNIYEKYGIGGNGSEEILSFTLRTEENSEITTPYEYSINGNVISLLVSYLTTDAVLEKAAAYIKISSGKDIVVKMDLTKEQTYTVMDPEGNKRTYIVKTERVTYNLPVFYIEIEDDAEVVSREEYLNATVRVDAENASGEFPCLDTTDILIRGRGHYSWKFDKKSYKIRFDKKTSVMGMNASKNWVLISNYVDRSLIQNYIALEMGKIMDNIPYHSTQYPVDVFVNGKYRGVYTFGEQLEVKPERIQLTESYDEPDTDYLLEVGGHDDGDVLNRDYFHVGTLKFVAVKHPDSSKLSQNQIDYLIDYIKRADEAVCELDGYDEYIDLDSLIDWVIMHEISYNLDCCFRRSCYLIKEKGGKLKMGPIWDFDLGFGSFYRYQEGDWATIGTEGGYVGITWMNYLKKDKVFMSKLRDRWNEIKDSLLEKAISSIDSMSIIIQPSAQMNFTVWDILGKSVPSQPNDHKKYNTYELQIERLRTFIQDRYEWLDGQLNTTEKMQ